VVVLNAAQTGLLAMLKVQRVAVRSLAAGVNAYALPWCHGRRPECR